MSAAKTARAMLDAGCTAEQIVIALEALEGPRSLGAERQRRYRERRAEASHVTLCDVTSVTNVTGPSPLCPPFPSPDPNPYPPISPQPQPSSSSGERELERECRQIVGAEPVALAQDFAALAAIQSEGVTASDIVAGVRAAMACEGFRPMAWRQMIGWARRAAKDRLGGAAKIVGSPPARAGPERISALESIRRAAETMGASHAAE